MRLECINTKPFIYKVHRPSVYCIISSSYVISVAAIMEEVQYCSVVLGPELHHRRDHIRPPPPPPLPLPGRRQ